MYRDIDNMSIHDRWSVMTGGRSRQVSPKAGKVESAFCEINYYYYSRTPVERPPSPTTIPLIRPHFRVTDSAFCMYTNPSRATIPLIRPHQCDSEGGRIRGVLLYNHFKNTILQSTLNTKSNPVMILNVFIKH